MSGILSALSSMHSPDAIIVLTDGAVYDRGGALLTIKRKVTVSDRLPLAVAFRGNLLFGELVAQMIIRSAEEVGFDQMLVNLEADLASFPVSPDLEILIAGVSETARPMHRKFSNKQLVGSEHPAFTLIDPGQLHWGLSSHTLEPIGLNDIGIPAPGKDETLQTWLARYGVSIFNFHRRMRVPIDPSDPNTDRRHLVGGILDMTVVTRHSVSTTLLHRWPDVVGEKIDPRPMAPQRPINASSATRRAA